MPDLSEVPVDPADHRLPAVTHFPRDRVRADRRPGIQSLEPNGAVGVPKHLRPDLAFLPACSHCDRIEQLPEIGQHRFLTGPKAREQQFARRTLGQVTLQSVPELWPERHRSMTGDGLQSTPVVWPKRHDTAIEGEIVNLESQDLRFSSSRK